MTNTEPPLKVQLIEARAKIIAQLDDMNFRSTASGFARRGGPPDYRSVVAELQGQLSEIDAILATEDSPDA